LSSEPRDLSRILDDPGGGARYSRRARKGQALQGTVILIALTLTWAVLMVLRVSDDPLSMRIKHYLTAPGCGMAEVLDLAPARAGQPGYWPWLDENRDGWACKAYRLPSGKIARH